MPAVLEILLGLMLSVGSTVSFCTSYFTILDLGCHLHWNCSSIDSNTTFIVQAKTQGREYENVSDCFQISSTSCDLSQVFYDFHLSNFAKLGLSHGHGELQWMHPLYCDPTKDSVFSPPSVSVSVEDVLLSVEVIFPCAPAVACRVELEDEYEDEEGKYFGMGSLSCCYLPNVITLNTTVTLYNKKNKTDTQSYTEPEVKGSVYRIEFAGLVRGQEYCIVAHFKSSPRSSPQCVHILPLEILNPLLPVVLGLCGMFIASLLIMAYVYRNRWKSQDAKIPKNLMSLDQEVPFVVEFRPPVLEEEASVDHLSIISYASLELCENHSTYPQSQSLGDCYYTSTILQQHPEEEGDIRSEAEDMETDGVSFMTRVPDLSLGSGPKGLLGVAVLLREHGIPLSSVRVAGELTEVRELDDMSRTFTNQQFLKFTGCVEVTE